MVSRNVLACLALLCVASAAALSLEAGDSAGRKLQTWGSTDNSGVIRQKVKQEASNKAYKAEKVNQANANQNANAAGADSWASNGLSISQSNGRKLQGDDNSGLIRQKVKQEASNKAVKAEKINQANANQNANAAGKEAYAANTAHIDQSNGWGRKLQTWGSTDNSGVIRQKVKQDASNKAYKAEKVNQANANQNANAAGEDAQASNSAYVTQHNGRKLQGDDNSGLIRQKVKQEASNKAVKAEKINQANANQNANAAGKEAWASNGLTVSQSNGRKLQGDDNSGLIRQKVKQEASNKAVKAEKINQANANQNANAAGKEAWASNGLTVSQSNGWGK